MSLSSFRRGRRRGLVTGAVVGSALSKKQAASAQNQPAATQPATAPSLAGQLKELKELRDQDLITDAEYQAKKTQILGL